MLKNTVSPEQHGNNSRNEWSICMQDNMKFDHLTFVHRQTLQHMPLTGHKGHQFHFSFAKYLTILQLDGIHSHIVGENDLSFPLLPFSILANSIALFVGLLH
jgi:hypothetical protein